jgi:ribonuclease HI
MSKIRIYTDGACSGNPGPGGWAAILLFDSSRQEISGYEADTTNNRMELVAVHESLKLAISLGYKKIDVYTDSAYVVNAKNKGWLRKWQENGWQNKDHEPVKNKEVWKPLSEMLNKYRDVNFIKVKGHSDNEHNNRCDLLAKREIERMKASKSA